MTAIVPALFAVYLTIGIGLARAIVRRAEGRRVRVVGERMR